MGKKKHSVNMMFTVMLLCIFALAAIFVAVLGAKVYANSAEKLQANFDTRTSIVYLSEKVRTNPGAGVDVRSADGGTALVLTEEISGKVYESWVFVSNGNLCETVVPKGDTPNPAAAQKIMQLASLDAELKDGGVYITVVTTEGEENTTFISGRTGQ
ncbi:MAG: DUF4860 domain-containing protein [Clostridiales Family XIII bacterium]|jgi:hypothetical protein|nr:DUF4860 domain-containing protein [Clostridiales Family XIII bacterium]